MNPQVDTYFEIGCMRCPKGKTPECKALRWRPQMERLRSIVLSSELTEEVKWGVPCYTYNGKNVLILSAFNDYCSISFFKGSLLSDPEALLHQPGKHSQASRLLRYTTLDEIEAQLPAITTFIHEAIEIEKAGREVVYKQTSDYEIPEELASQFANDPAFQAAFESLTPGRQRGYLIYFAAPKKSETRHNRIEKYREKIFAGQGLHDR